MKNLNRELSQDLARRVHARPRECWRNALLAMLFAPGPVEYVEGWLTLGSMSISVEHGWLETPTEILDVTLWEAGYAGVCYHAALRWTPETVQKLMRRHRGTLRLPLVYALRDEGLYDQFLRVYRDSLPPDVREVYDQMQAHNTKLRPS